MSEQHRPPLTLLSTGVPGLDEVLGGGLPEYSFNLISGVPGSGKTTLMHQILFANATPERRALYFTIVGEPALKMLRYQQQMAFFDARQLGDAIQFIDLSQEALTGDLDKVLEIIVAKVAEVDPAFVVFDSFRTLIRAHELERDAQVPRFLQRLAMHLTSWQVTSFLSGEFAPGETQDNPVLTIADAIVVLSQSRERNSIVRKLEVMKMRGMATVAGLHTFRITTNGVQVFPRMTSRAPGRERFLERRRSCFDVPALDEMIGGGLPTGDATMIAGPSGTGKTVLCTHFITAGVRHQEPGVLAVFEEHPDDYLQRAADMGFDLRGMVDAGMLKVLSLRPLDLSADEILFRIHEAVEEIGARRLVIDSLNGLELALAPTYREDFRESLYRMVGGLTGGGVSVLFTIEVAEAFAELRITPNAISFLAQNIMLMRYIEIEGELRRVITVVKMRRSAHSRELREYAVTNHGFELVGRLAHYSGVLTGTPRTEVPVRATPTGLTHDEHRLLLALSALGEVRQAELIERTGVAAPIVERGLRRLIDLEYILELEEDDVTVYRVLEPGPGA